jgi:hypothetical protein
MENTHILKYDHYGVIRWQIETTWEKSIDMCRQLTKQFENKFTRHSSCTSAVSHMDHYFDLYNEIAIMLTRKELVESN